MRHISKPQPVANKWSSWNRPARLNRACALQKCDFAILDSNGKIRLAITQLCCRDAPMQLKAQLESCIEIQKAVIYRTWYSFQALCKFPPQTDCQNQACRAIGAYGCGEKSITRWWATKVTYDNVCHAQCHHNHPYQIDMMVWYSNIWSPELRSALPWSIYCAAWRPLWLCQVLCPLQAGEEDRCPDTWGCGLLVSCQGQSPQWQYV